ncbi:hypothetical protein JCM30394_04570 [Deferrisoma palaeochoriense]
MLEKISTTRSRTVSIWLYSALGARQIRGPSIAYGPGAGGLVPAGRECGTRFAAPSHAVASPVGRGAGGGSS